MIRALAVLALAVAAAMLIWAPRAPRAARSGCCIVEHDA